MLWPSDQLISPDPHQISPAGPSLLHLSEAQQPRLPTSCKLVSSGDTAGLQLRP